MNRPAPADRPRILLVDDDVELCELVATLLEQNGMQVETCPDGSAGLARAREESHDILILDVQLPQLNGFEVLRALRKDSSLPVLMLTARGSEEDRFTGLEQGADDYLPKPFHPRELIARIRAILRRTHRPEDAPSTERKVGDLHLHSGRREVRAHGKLLRCTDAEFEILACLMESPGHPIDREHLVRAALGRDYDPRDRSLDVHVSHLRKRLQQGGVQSTRIVTVRGEGYLIATAGQDE
jgi:two-component system response regulator CpxR